MAVEELGGIAHRIRGNGTLALQVELAGGFGREDHLEVQLGEEGEPEGEIFVHIQSEGDADASPGTVTLAHALKGAELFVLEVHEIGELHPLLAQRTGAAVA